MNDNTYRPKLIFLGEPFAGRVYELTLEKTTVGRGDHNTLAIHDPSVSLAHCEILVNGPEVIVRDLDSSNGTFVKGVRLRDQQSQIQSGQLVRFGSVEARLELDPSAIKHTATEHTAVYELSRIMRDQRREQNNPRPANASMKLASISDSASDDHTVMLTKPTPPQAATALAVPESSEVPSTRRTVITVIIVIAAAFALVLAVLLWLMWARR